MPHDDSARELGPFQLALLVLSLLLLAGLAIEIVVPVPREISRLIFFIDTGVCAMLLTDLAWRFHHAPSKLRFMRWGWIDLIASIPALEVLRWGRLFRVVRVIRLLVALNSLRRLLTLLVGKRRQTGLASLLVFTVLMVSFASVGMLLLETHPDSNIRTAEDALWWSLTTITTVGYGDRYPVTEAGRLVASLLMICGIGLFGTLSGVAASFFLGSNSQETPAAPAPDSAAIDALEARVARLEKSAGPDQPPPA